MNKLDRIGVSPDLDCGCVVAKIADVRFSQFKPEFIEARTKHKIQPFIDRMRAYVAHELKVPVLELVRLETQIALGMSVDDINKQLAAWSAPIRLNDREEWIVLDSEVLLPSLNVFYEENLAHA